MEDIQINEERLLEWQEKNTKINSSWLDKIYNKTNNYISQHFHEVLFNYREWKKLMTTSEQSLKNTYEMYKKLPVYYSTGFCPYYFKQKDYVKFKSSWDIYSRFAKNPNNTECYKFLTKWSSGQQRHGSISYGILDFEEMFITCN